MGESLTQRRRVEEDGLRVVNSCQWRREWTVPTEEASANYVPAAAVRRREQALSGITGRKELVGGSVSPRGNLKAQLWGFLGYCVS
jgi:hypothetical protein